MARRGPRLVVPVSVDDREFAQGLERSLRRFQANSSKMGAATDKAVTRVTRSMARADRSWTTFAARHERAIGRIRRALLGWTSAYAGLISVYGLGSLTRSITMAGIRWEGLKASMKAATGTSRSVEREFRFVKDEANRLGVEQMALAQSFTQLAAAAKGTVVEGQRVRDVFTAVAEAARVMQLSPPEVVRVFKAFSQIISKGKFSAEELRQQLGEVMPAFQMLARSMDLEPAVLDKMLQRGEVLLDQLPGLAEEIRRTYAEGLTDAQHSTAASFDRLRNSWTDLKIAIAESGVLELLKWSADTIRSGIDHSAMFRIRMSEPEEVPETLKGFSNRQLDDEIARYKKRIQELIDLRSGLSVRGQRAIAPFETGRMAESEAELKKYYALISAVQAEKQRRAEIELELPPALSLEPPPVDEHAARWKQLEKLYEKTRTPAERLSVQIEEVTAAFVAGGPYAEKYREILERLHAAKAKLTGGMSAQTAAWVKLQAVIKSTRTPAERLQSQIEDVNAAIALGGPHLEVYRETLERLETEYAALGDGTESMAEKMRAAFESLDQSAARNFSSMLMGAQSFGETFANIFGGLADKLIQAGMLELLGPLFGGLGLGGGMAKGLGLEGSSFAFAEGGPVKGGRAVVVGERGKELFVPREDGYIVPAHRISERALTPRSRQRDRMRSPLDALMGTFSRGLGFSTGLGQAISRGFSPPAIWGRVDTGRPPATEIGRHASTFAAPSYGGIVSTGTFGVPSSGAVSRSAGFSAVPDDDFVSSAMTFSAGDFHTAVGHHTAGWGRGLSGGGEGGGAGAGYGGPGGGPSGGSPHRAEGGAVSRGMSVIVGERGKELFVPREDGYIVPAHRISERALTPRSRQRDRMQNAFDPLSLGLGFALGGPIDALMGTFARGLGFSTGLGQAISRGFSPPAIWGRVDTGRPPATEIGRHASTFAAPSYGGIVSAGTFGVPSSGAVSRSAGFSAVPDDDFVSSAMTFSAGDFHTAVGHHTAGWGRGLSGGGEGGGAGAGYGGPGGGPSGGSPHRAEGGAVSRGMSVIVGERGRELFVPTLGVGGGGIRAPSVPRVSRGTAGRSGPTIYVDASGADVAAVERIEAMVGRIDGNLEQRAVSAVVQQQKRFAF